MKVNFVRKIGVCLIAAWFVITGLGLLGVNLPIPGAVMGVLAVAAGVLFVLDM